MLKLTIFGSPNDDTLWIKADTIVECYTVSSGAVPFTVLVLDNSGGTLNVKESPEEVKNGIAAVSKGV